MPEFIFVADIADPDDPQGRTYRQINATKKHALEQNTLVEYRSTNETNYPYKNFPRAFIAVCGRDCDETPLYWLTLNRYNTIQKQPRRNNEGWFGGCSEACVFTVKEEKTHNSATDLIPVGTLVETTHLTRAFVVHAEYDDEARCYWYRLCLDYKDTNKHYEDWYNFEWEGPYHAGELQIVEGPKSRI